MKVCLVVKVIDKETEKLTKAYVKELDLPFIPVIGMKFKRSAGSTWLWETGNGELSPAVKEVVYNIDEEMVYCLFEINENLVASFWHEIPHGNLNNSFELMQFTIHS